MAIVDETVHPGTLPRKLEAKNVQKTVVRV